MKILILISFLLPAISQAVNLKVTHPRIEQKPEKTFELICEKDCSFTIKSRKETIGKIELKKVLADLKAVEELAPVVSGSRKPIMPERGSLEVQLKDNTKKIDFQLYLPPATQWPKDKAQVYAKFSEAITRLEFLMEKGRTKK